MQEQILTHARKQRGFTLIEVMVATLLLLVGIVAVAQLVPASLTSNTGNRNDSTALVLAQRELAQMLGQPLATTTLIPTFTDSIGNPCTLGNHGAPDTVVGSPLGSFNNRPVIDFAADRVAGYNFNYNDLQDPSGTSYDVRWAVITTVNPAVGPNFVTSKRFILGARRRGGNGYFLPVNLDAMVAR